MAKADTSANARPIPVLSLGLRPFFLLAGLFAVVSVGLWIFTYRGIGGFAPAHGGVDWHMHEMVFGYTSAVLAGFLLTAIPNWTGRRPINGTPLAGLVLLWLAGRGAMAAAPQVPAAWVDAAFLPVMTAVAGREIIGGRNWRNLAVLVPVTVLAVANILFHVQSFGAFAGDYALRLGLAAIAMLLMLIGGRIIPAFTRNWLKQQGAASLPVEFDRFDRLCLLAAVLALLAWVAAPLSAVTGAALCIVAILHGLRLRRWAGMAARHNPILFVLHLFYAMIPAGLLVLGVAGLTDDHVAHVAGLHLLGIGGIGGMTLAVMSRAGLGHTGRALRSGAMLNIGYGCLVLAAFLRALAGAMPDPLPWIDAAGLFWMLAFGLFILRLGPALLAPRADGK